MDRSAKDPHKIQNMFSTIADRYDLLNRVLSLGIDRQWRRYAVSQIPRESAMVLDVATGTGDVALEIAKTIPGARVTGIDFSEGMLAIGREKAARSAYADRIDMRLADVTSLPFEDGIFDAAIVAFGIRNVQDYQKGISEMGRVLRKGGRLVVLEFTNVQTPLFRPIYLFYIKKIMPWIGELISGRKGAYEYLPESMLAFPPPEEFKRAMEGTGLINVRYRMLSLGIAAVHTGVVP